MANWAKKARKRGYVEDGREVTALVQEAKLDIRRRGSHCNCKGMVPWMERELATGTAKSITKRLKALGLLLLPIAMCVAAYVYLYITN